MLLSRRYPAEEVARPFPPVYTPHAAYITCLLGHYAVVHYVPYIFIVSFAEKRREHARLPSHIVGKVLTLITADFEVFIAIHYNKH